MQSRSGLYEARIADMKEAHAREVAQLSKVIDVLAEQVEYLRAVGGRPQLVPRVGVPTHQLEPPTPPLFQSDFRMSEEEEDLRAMHENNLLDVEELKSALAELGVES